MNRYTVTVKQADVTEPDAFAGLHRLDENAVVEFVESVNGKEVYTITTEADIDTMLNHSYMVLDFHCGKA